jgi:hypothetical protein
VLASGPGGVVQKLEGALRLDPMVALRCQ